MSEVLTEHDYTHPIDSAAYVDCPNDDCDVGRVSLDSQWDDDLLECEYCGAAFRLMMADIEVPN